MNWREVIHKYLTALAQDTHDCRQQANSVRERTFMQSYATLACKERYIQKMDDFLKFEAPLQSPETYKVIEEHPQLVIAEVEGVDRGQPMVLTRFRLRRDNSSWLLDDIFWKCVCSDENGKCFDCKGTGKCTFCEGSGTMTKFWGIIKVKCVLCGGQPICQQCSGTGLCKHCSESDMPGWNSITTASTATSEPTDGGSI